MRLNPALLTVMLLLAAIPARAALPPELTGHIAAAEPASCGVYRWLIKDIYTITLWTDGPVMATPALPFALSIRYDMTFDASEITDKSIELMRREARTVNVDQYRAPLLGAMHAVKPGDRITALFQPDLTLFFYNGQPTAEIQGRDFMQLFAGIWLDSKTTAPELRNQLLSGATCNKE